MSGYQERNKTYAEYDRVLAARLACAKLADEAPAVCVQIVKACRDLPCGGCGEHPLTEYSNVYSQRIYTRDKWSELYLGPISRPFFC